MATSSRGRRRRNRAAYSAKKLGVHPGAPPVVASVPDVPVVISVVDYDVSAAREVELDRVVSVPPFVESGTVTWFNVPNLEDAAGIHAVGTALGLHPLWIEDILNASGRPKAESLDGKLFVVARMLSVSDGEHLVDVEQVSLVLGPGWVLTVQERPGDVWGALRERIRGGVGRVRRKGADYLFHALLDAVVDHYFVVLEQLESRVDEVEEKALEAMKVDVRAIFALRGEIAAVRQAAWPMREIGSALLRDEASAIAEENTPYFRDLYDHVVLVMDILETSRERVMGVFELHLAVNGNRLNEVMRVLTVVSTVFIPMTFVAGVYGMNFVHMPELQLRWAYPVVWLLMVSTGGGMLLWLRRKDWM